MAKIVWSWVLESYINIIIVLVCAVIVWILRGRFEKLNNRLKKCENDATDIAEIKNEVGRLRADFNSMRMDIESIKEYFKL